MRHNAQKYLKTFYGFYKVAFVVFFVVAFAQAWACYVMTQNSATALGMGLIYSLIIGTIVGVTWPLSVIIAIAYISQSLIIFVLS